MGVIGHNPGKGRLEGRPQFVGNSTQRRLDLLGRDPQADRPIGLVGEINAIEAPSAIDDGLVARLADVCQHVGHGLVDVNPWVEGTRQDLVEGR
jgi:hypothetical protein